jgi:hypothetical protein
LCWLGLCILTLLSLGLGQWFHAAAWLPLLVAVIVWVKGTVVARYFIESDLTHSFIRRLLKVFIAFAPLWLILTGFYGGQFAQWGSLFLKH